MKYFKNVKTLKYICIFLLSFCITSVFGQGFTITGTVTDDTGDILPGVSVFVRGTNLGTVSDVDGRYRITVSNQDAVLVFSSIGYQTQDIAIGGRIVIDVTMFEDVAQLDEVIVIGFGTTTRETLTGSVATISAAELDSRPVAGTVQALQGLVAGLNVDPNTGRLDARPSFNVRGPGTIGTGSSGAPLVIVDGLEGDLNLVNPNDIESISVLKDAAASAIYGSRAAFGVIIVTTKQGQAGPRANINYSYNLRISSPIRMPEMMDSWSWMIFQNTALANAGAANPRYSDLTIQRALMFQRGEPIYDAQGNRLHNNVPIAGTRFWAEGYNEGFDNVDYIDVMFHTVSYDQEHNVSISGGSGDLTYFASFNYLQRYGFLKRRYGDASCHYRH